MSQFWRLSTRTHIDNGKLENINSIKMSELYLKDLFTKSLTLKYMGDVAHNVLGLKCLKLW